MQCTGAFLVHQPLSVRSLDSFNRPLAIRSFAMIPSESKFIEFRQFRGHHT
jgi:hypothetical protein